MSAARRFSPDLAGRLAGAGLPVATGAVHLDPCLGGYRTIPTIGTLFLIQVASAFLLAVAVASTTSWAIAAVGAGFALATLGGYLLSMSVGLFGFEEVPTEAAPPPGRALSSRRRCSASPWRRRRADPPGPGSPSWRGLHLLG